MFTETLVDEFPVWKLDRSTMTKHGTVLDYDPQRYNYSDDSTPRGKVILLDTSVSPMLFRVGKAELPYREAWKFFDMSEHMDLVRAMIRYNNL